MLRLTIILATILLSLSAVGPFGSEDASWAQVATPATEARHPLVGVWLLDEAGKPGASTSVALFTEDGLVIDTCCNADMARVGAWRATGERTADVTLVVVFPGEGGFSAIYRAAFEVDPSGETLTGPWTFTLVSGDGQVQEVEEFATQGVRISVEGVAATGSPLPVMPVWDPGTPVPATPNP